MTGKIDGLPVPEGPSRTRSGETRRTREDTRSLETRRSGDADSVDISETARLKEAVLKLPDIREDRLAQVRERIAAGDYDSDKVRQLIADRLLDRFAP